MIGGITGHQDLGDEATAAWVEGSLRARVREHGITHGLTSLAVGADQLFATVLAKAGIPFTAIVPCREYESAFRTESGRLRYAELLALASDTVVLDHPGPDGQAFLDAGRLLVDRADLLFAVWNGLPAKGPGGTADVVDYAVRQNRPVLHLDVTTRAVRRLG